MRFPDGVLAEHWGLSGADVRPHHGGMNSATWFVTADRRRYVAKVAGGWFPGGIAVADALARRGFASGGPVRTTDGRRTVEVDGGEHLALLAFVPGAPLTAADQHAIGTTLAEVHRLLRDVAVEHEVAMDWIDPDAPHLGLRPWLRGAVAAAVRDLAAAGPLTTGLLHADPAPEAFLGGGLIDWGVAMRVRCCTTSPPPSCTSAATGRRSSPRTCKPALCPTRRSARRCRCCGASGSRCRPTTSRAGSRPAT